MHRRAELVDQTRQRIIDAAVHLHTSVGPASTSISTIAEEAGVTRLTVYRHFADLDELFVACRGHWIALHPPPDPASWAEVEDLLVRARLALTELYGWYARNSADLYPINRDETAMPEATQHDRRLERAALAAAIVGRDARGGPAARRTRAVAGHLVSYWTWRSLVVDEGLSGAEAVDLGVELLARTASPASGPGRS